MFRRTFSKPRSLGIIPRDVFTDLRDVCGKSSSVDLDWHPNEIPSWHGRNLEALNPLHEAIINTSLVRRLHLIRYSISLNDIPPRATQRGPGWHRDSGAGLAVAVADSLPTEFLVLDPARRYSIAAALARRKQIRNLVGDVFFKAHDTEIEKAGLQV